MRVTFTPQQTFWITLAVVLLFKLCLFGWGVSQFNFQASPQETALTIWNRWDSQAYQTIARSGYIVPEVAPDYQAFLSHFPPFYPLLIAALTIVVPLPPFAVALGLAWLFGLLASAVLYLLAWLEWQDTRKAILAVAFFNLYPTAYFTIVPYTESLFILCALLTFLFVRHLSQHNYLGGLSAGLAIMTRLLGIALIPSILWEFGRKIKNKSLHHQDVWLLILPVVAITIYLGINQYYFGHPLFFLQEYNQNIYSNKHTSWPFKETIAIVQALFQRWQTSEGWDVAYMTVQGWNAIFTLMATVITLWSAVTRRIPVAYWLYSLTYILLFASFQWGISNARYTLALFPMFIALGTIKNKLVVGGLLLLSTYGLLYFTKLFVGGGWAF